MALENGSIEHIRIETSILREEFRFLSGKWEAREVVFPTKYHRSMRPGSSLEVVLNQSRTFKGREILYEEIIFSDEPSLDQLETFIRDRAQDIPSSRSDITPSGKKAYFRTPLGVLIAHNAPHLRMCTQAPVMGAMANLEDRFGYMIAVSERSGESAPNLLAVERRQAPADPLFGQFLEKFGEENNHLPWIESRHYAVRSEDYLLLLS